jgi:hypothetical protein
MDKPSKVVPESVEAPLVGMRWNEVLENRKKHKFERMVGMQVAQVVEKRNEDRILCIGTVMEIKCYNGCRPHCRIRFETLTGKDGPKEVEWDINRARVANNYYKYLKALSPLIGLRVAVTEKDAIRKGVDEVQMGTVMEWVREDDETEDDETVGPPYCIKFDTTTERGVEYFNDEEYDDRYKWSIERVHKGNRRYNNLQKMFLNRETRFLNERVAIGVWFGVVVEYLGREGYDEDKWRVQWEKSDDEDNTERRPDTLDNVMVQEAVRYFRSLKEWIDPTLNDYWTERECRR